MTTITLEAGAAQYLAEALLPAVSKDDVTPVLTGVHLSVEDGKLRGLSTDRYRVHAVLLSLYEAGPDELDVPIPRAAVLWLSKNARAFSRSRGPFKPTVVLDFTDSTPGRVTITVRQDAEAENGDRMVFSTGLISGKFPPVLKLIEGARDAELVDGVASLRLDYLASMRALGGSELAPVMRFTKPKDGSREGVVHIRYGDYAEAIIQPNRRV